MFKSRVSPYDNMLKKSGQLWKGPDPRYHADPLFFYSLFACVEYFHSGQRGEYMNPKGRTMIFFATIACSMQTQNHIAEPILPCRCGLGIVVLIPSSVALGRHLLSSEA